MLIMDASDIERLIENGMRYDLVVCKAAHFSDGAYQKERDLLELLVRSGDVSRLVLISDVLVGRQHKALLEHLSCAHVMSLAPPLSPERIQLHLAPYLFKYAKQLSSTTTPLFSSH